MRITHSQQELINILIKMIEGQTQTEEMVAELFRDILDRSLDDICKNDEQIPNKPLPSLITHTYSKVLNVHHGKSYQQYTDNLCGYHAVYNTLCFLHTIKHGQSRYNFLSGASFWSFKRKIETFLLNMKEQSGYEDQWPWREQDILFGDFERSYNELCMYFFEDFEILRDFEHLELFSYTWEFQYKNLLMSDQNRLELESTMAYFRDYDGDKPVIVSFMLGITDHWMCFFAVKLKGQAQYWFFDSNNMGFLELDQKGIEDYVEQLDKERIELRKEGFKPFDKKNIGVCMTDTQISLKLIIDCFQGRTTLEQYSYNQQFNVFAHKLEWCYSSGLPIFQQTLRDYQFNIQTFFEVPVRTSIFTQQNQARLAKLIAYTATHLDSSYPCKKFYQLSTNSS